MNKTAAGYRHEGTYTEHCSICAMFRKPSVCIKVMGVIQPSGLCNFFLKKVTEGGTRPAPNYVRIDKE